LAKIITHHDFIILTLLSQSCFEGKLQGPAPFSGRNQKGYSRIIHSGPTINFKGKIKEINREKSRAYWFGPEETRFFNTMIESEVYSGHGGIYFVTSERMELSMEKKFSVRSFNPETGTIDTIGDFQQYRKLEDAKDAARTYSIEGNIFERGEG